MVWNCDKIKSLFWASRLIKIHALVNLHKFPRHDVWKYDPLSNDLPIWIFNNCRKWRSCERQNKGLCHQFDSIQRWNIEFIDCEMDSSSTPTLINCVCKYLFSGAFLHADETGAIITNKIRINHLSIRPWNWWNFECVCCSLEQSEWSVELTGNVSTWVSRRCHLLC